MHVDQRAIDRTDRHIDTGTGTRHSWPTETLSTRILKHLALTLTLTLTLTVTLTLIMTLRVITVKSLIEGHEWTVDNGCSDALRGAHRHLKR